MVTRLHDDAVTARVGIHAARGRRQALRGHPGREREAAIRDVLKASTIDRHEVRDAVELERGVRLAGHAGGRTGRAGARPDIAVSRGVREGAAAGRLVEMQRRKSLRGRARSVHRDGHSA